VSSPRANLAIPVIASVALHISAAALLTVAARDTATALPPIYKVDIVAAPPGPRSPGVVTRAPAPENPAPAAEPPRSIECPPKEMPAPPATKTARPSRERPVATPVPNPTPARTKDAPRAGGGDTGGKGADVATVRTEGIEFPYPGYLNNIVRQIALSFNPRNRGSLSADVFFMIHRDGSVSGFRFIKRSGDFEFDLEAQGAVEAAAAAKAFGSLPSGFQNDVLPVVFSFDPRIIR
jgi:periplasmic protein TonB